MEPYPQTTWFSKAIISICTFLRCWHAYWPTVPHPHLPPISQLRLTLLWVMLCTMLYCYTNIILGVISHDISPSEMSAQGLLPAWSPVVAPTSACSYFYLLPLRSLLLLLLLPLLWLFAASLPGALYLSISFDVDVMDSNSLSSHFVS